MFWQTIRAVLWKDLTLERHTGQTISIMVFFSLAAVITFNLALVRDLSAAREVSAGLLWATILLAGTLGLNRSFSAEHENKSFDALLMAPANRSALYLGKVLSILIFTLLLELALMFIFTIFFNRPFLRPAAMGLVALGTVGFVAAGVLVTAMTVQTRSREVLLPILLLPLTLPAVLAASYATALLIFLDNPTWDDVGFAVSLVTLYDLLMLTAGFFTFRYVVEE